MKFRPTHRNLVVQLQEPRTKTPSGLHLPMSAFPTQEEAARGVVIAIGPNAIHVQVSDLVLIEPHAGSRFRDNKGNEFVVLTEEQVRTVILEDDEV